MKKLSQWPTDKKIVALDFDGTITTGDTRIWHNNTYTNDVFTQNHDVVNWVLQHRNDMYLILWTCRCGNALDDAIKYANSLGIYFDSINDNIVQFDCSNKIMADIYIDDKAININNLKEVF